MRWMDNIRHDMNKCGLEEGDAQDRRRWRRMVQNHDLALQLDKREKRRKLQTIMFSKWPKYIKKIAIIIKLADPGQAFLISRVYFIVEPHHLGHSRYWETVSLLARWMNY